MSDSSNLDPAAMQRLQRLGGDGFTGKMIELFLGYAVEKLTDARRELETGTLAGVSNAVHPLKSSSGNVGARRMQELTLRIEEAAGASRREEVAALLADLDAAFAAVKPELEAIKRNLTPPPPG